ncbi:MAG: endonuclease G [Pseudohongiellaceae bacterium]|jgi:endonuclease G
MTYISKYFIRWASLFSLLVATIANAQTVHISHCMAGCPVVADSIAIENSELIVRQLYVASINARSGLADWQAYRVLADSVGVASLLPRVWFEDPLVLGGATQIEVIDSTPQIEQEVPIDAEERSYQLGGINLFSEDQGRLVPMSSFAGTPYWSELNFLSNMAALPFKLRAGSWSRLDQAINALADKIGEVYVVSGPIYRERGEEMSESAAKPSAYFKVISTPDSLSAFIFDSDVRQHVSFCDQVSTLDLIEDATGLTLFPQRVNGITDTLHAQLTCRF